MKPDPVAGAAEDQTLPSESRLSELLQRSALLKAVGYPTPDPIAGIAVGMLRAIDAAGRPLVDVPVLGLHAVPASSMVSVRPEQVGRAVALGFELGHASSPVVLGFMVSPPPSALPPAPALTDARVDGQRVVIEGAREVELRCGEAAIVLSADGRIELRGTHVTSQASATQRILGGSVHIN